MSKVKTWQERVLRDRNALPKREMQAEIDELRAALATVADAQKTIDLIFNGVDRTGAATLAALDNARKFSGSVKDITQPVADFTLGAAKLEAGMLAAGVAMTVFAAKTAGDFEQSFAQISTLFDASADDVARFKQDILAYAATSGKSLKDITESLQAAIGSGVEYSKSLELVSVDGREWNGVPA